jgi:hypothetical protein
MEARSDSPGQTELSHVAVGSHEQQPWLIGHTHAAVGYVKLLRKPEGSIWMRPVW